MSVKQEKTGIFRGKEYKPTTLEGHMGLGFQNLSGFRKIIWGIYHCSHGTPHGNETHLFCCSEMYEYSQEAGKKKKKKDYK